MAEPLTTEPDPAPEPTSPATPRLIDERGDVRLGIFDAPVLEVNHHDYLLTDPFGRPRGRLARHFAYNRFQFLGGLSEQLVFGCAIADVGWASTAFVYAWEPASGRVRERSFRRPLAVGTRFDPTPERGAAAFRAGRNRLTITTEGAGDDGRARRRRLVVVLDDGATIDTVLHEDDPPTRPMWICTRAGASGWVFARKTAATAVTGSLRWGETAYDLGAIDARGHHDWSAGFMRRQTFWNWGSLAGRLADGRPVGLNVSCGVNETSFTENCFWVAGALRKVDTVHFAYDRRDLTAPWRITSSDGAVDLTFHPERAHRERVNAAVVATNFHQLAGRYRGSLRTAAGERLAVDGTLGYAEEHYAKW